jgi:NAD(P)-dependent dehydrogenase (short-subunit alcohol dehydrogenase family)
MTGAQNPFSFAGQKAVVIAGSAGIGKGIAELIAQLGGQVGF